MLAVLLVLAQAAVAGKTGDTLHLPPPIATTAFWFGFVVTLWVTAVTIQIAFRPIVVVVGDDGIQVSGYTWYLGRAKARVAYWRNYVDTELMIKLSLAYLDFKTSPTAKVVHLNLPGPALGVPFEQMMTDIAHRIRSCKALESAGIDTGSGR